MGLFKKKTKQKTERWFVNCLNEEMTHESLFMCQHWASRPSPSPPIPSVPPNEDKADVIRSNTTAITTYCVHTPICQAISPENHVNKTTKKRGGGNKKNVLLLIFQASFLHLPFNMSPFKSSLGIDLRCQSLSDPLCACPWLPARPEPRVDVIPRGWLEVFAPRLPGHSLSFFSHLHSCYGI